ncbi:MAG: hypothetical protein A4S16_02270 [Proteobacteria bacterium SG_bin6]|nr:MAG: hypothetical protein A4S16_02270 [Proteobacteria bacterium SG_bin6]
MHARRFWRCGFWLCFKPGGRRIKLYYAPPSPFARRVRVLIAEKRLAGIDQEAVNPFDLPPARVAANPLSKVPALVRDDGSVLFDSAVICEFLDQLDSESRLIPAPGTDRWTVLRRQALADGLMDTTLSLAIEVNCRSENEQSPRWIARRCTTIRRTADTLEAEVADFLRHDDGHHGERRCAAGLAGFLALGAGALADIGGADCAASAAVAMTATPRRADVRMAVVRMAGLP